MPEGSLTTFATILHSSLPQVGSPRAKAFLQVMEQEAEEEKEAEPCSDCFPFSL